MAARDEEKRSIPEQAARWWRVMQDDGPTAAEKRQFAAWAAESPRHIEEMLRMARVQAALSNPELRWPTDDRETLIRAARMSEQADVVPFDRSGAARDAVGAPFDRSGAARAADVVRFERPRASRSASKRGPRLPLALGLAATVLLALGIVWLMLPHAERFETKLGEQRSVLLSDGSRVTLNTASKIKVRLLAHRRVIDLEKGEALFQVAHDAQRPFDVRAGNVTARAVGTQFEVDRHTAQTVVSVVEGRVAVTAADAASSQLLLAGDRVSVDSTGTYSIEKNLDLSAALAWTAGQIVFRHTPLAAVAEELNRYNRERVEIRDPVLQKQELSGTVRTGDVASFVALIAGKPGVRVFRNDAGDYLVTGATPRQ